MSLLCLLAASALVATQKDDALKREQFEQMQAQFSTVMPAEASLSAYVKLNRIPFFTDRHGAAEKWVEIGPRVLKQGWGGWDNAGRTSAVIVDPHDSRTVYLGAASGGLWKSSDGCLTWRPLADYQASLCFGALAIDPFNDNVIYAGTGEAHYSLDSFNGVGLLRSRDAGETWELLGSDVFIGQRFTRIVPHPGRPGFIYGATTGGVYRSTDGGGSWVKLLNGPASDLIVNKSNPSSMIAAIGLPGGNPRNGLYKTVDAGDHWVKLSTDLPRDGGLLGRVQIDSCRSYPEILYVSFYGHSAIAGMYKTTDFGETWTHLPNAPDYAGDQSWYDNYLTVSPTNPNVVFVGGTSTFRTLDGGQTWQDNTRSYAGGAVHPDHHYLAFDPSIPNRAYLCTDGGMFRTSDLGETWESVSNGLGTVQIQFLDVHPSDKNVAYAGTQDNGTNKYTGDMAWTNTFLGDGGVTRVNPVNPNIVYTEYVGLVILKSTDSGLNWNGATTGINLRDGALFYAPFNLDPNNPSVLVAGTQRIWRSTDDAESWSAISPSLGGLVSAITIAPRNSSVIYAGTSGGRVWVTPNTGKDWYEISAGLRRAYVSDFAVDPRNSRHVYLSQNGWGGNRIWETHDAGGSWAPIGEGLPEVPIHMIALHPMKPDIVFLGTEIGVFISTNGGARWERFGKGLPNSPVFTVTPNAKTGYVTVGTHGRGAWRVGLP